MPAIMMKNVIQVNVQVRVCREELLLGELKDHFRPRRARLPCSLPGHPCDHPDHGHDHSYDHCIDLDDGVLQVATFEGWMEIMADAVDAREVSHHLPHHHHPHCHQ